MDVIPFKSEHIDQMKKSDKPQYLESGSATKLEGGLSFTALHDGVILGCGGVIEIWPGRLLAWAILSEDAERHWKSIHRAVKKFFKDMNAPRVEADVDPDFAGAILWVEKLGFTCEAPRRKGYFPDGRDAALYSLIGDDNG